MLVPWTVDNRQDKFKNYLPSVAESTPAHVKTLTYMTFLYFLQVTDRFKTYSGFQTYGHDHIIFSIEITGYLVIIRLFAYVQESVPDLPTLANMTPVINKSGEVFILVLQVH